MPPLPTDLRRLLEKKVVEARDAAEDAARGALKALAVDRSEPFSGMDESQREFRRVLRARARQLGSFHDPLDESEGFELLAAEIAYEQWHRMLFARFLSENDLLMHPTHGVPVTLQDCAELAPAEGEPDEWMLAARYASEMLPGIFRMTDPAVRVRFAPEGRQALERILSDLPPEVFAADDSLGWVYQFWQSKRKKEVNASERKIGGADLAPVTQLFTEHYMVAFLLENSLGAWWAGKHPESPLLKEWEYLRFAEDGTPAAGTFEGWSATVAEVTMMDPCCGSGHFLVAGFEMLRKMREEEEGLSPRDAADAVLKDNLFGLELDGRCIQIAVFALALSAWKIGGYRELPAMNVACSGVPARGTEKEWRALAQGDSRLADALERLYYLFKDADTLGSLIDPRRAAESDTLLGVDYDEVAPLLHEALSRFGGDDPAQQVFAQAAEDVATAASLLADRYTLVATNPPYLGSKQQTTPLAAFLARWHPSGKSDLAAAFMLRTLGMCGVSGRAALVVPEYWLYLTSFSQLRREMLTTRGLQCIARLGARAFTSVSGEIVRASLVIATRSKQANLFQVDVGDCAGPSEKGEQLRSAPLFATTSQVQAGNPGSAILSVVLDSGPLLEVVAAGIQGLSTADGGRFQRCHWEVLLDDAAWARGVSAPVRTAPHAGREHVIYWEQGEGDLSRSESAYLRGQSAWGRKGVLIGRMTLNATLYGGELFDDGTGVLMPRAEGAVPALWSFVSSKDYSASIRQLDPSPKVTNGTLVKVPFDLDHWTKVAAEKYPNGLPEPYSDDPTQWLFKGNIVGSESPLHVGAARLIGYSWPDQEPDELDRFSDPDGIVCLPPVGGERPAADRLLELLAAAYGSAWSQSVLEGLLASEGSPDLESWLRDKYFPSHCKLFHNRPFIWQIWDGRKDGFSALVNYHKLDHKLLQRLTYSTLQSWIDRQRTDAAQGVAAAEARQAAAEELKRKLELILEGQPPYDIYVRWKLLERQPIGWEPDINDGVRLNIRPFVEAGILRSKFTINWNKDRGKNPDGSERFNDLHLTVAEKRAVRAKGTTG